MSNLPRWPEDFNVAPKNRPTPTPRPVPVIVQGDHVYSFHITRRTMVTEMAQEVLLSVRDHMTGENKVVRQIIGHSNFNDNQKKELVRQHLNQMVKLMVRDLAEAKLDAFIEENMRYW